MNGTQGHTDTAKRIRGLLGTALALALCACAAEDSQPREGEPQQFALYSGHPLEPWRMSLRDGDQEQILSGSQVRLPSGRATLVTRDKERQGDALAFQWQDTWFAEVSMRHGKPLDLAGFIERGSLAFDLKVKDLEGGDLSLSIGCGENCERRLDITLEARASEGKGWQEKRFKLSCLVDPGEDWSQVSVPFALRGGGAGEVEIANIRLLRNGENERGTESACPEREAIAVTPAERYEYWATTGWWEERRARNLERLAQGNVELLMLGDSITEGWEREGKALWDKLYAPRGAVNLGYGGDKTENLLWRLQNGELDGISPRAAVVMIGTNNTGHRLENPRFTAAGIRAVLDELRARQPQMKILLLGIFPRDAQPGTPMRKINSATNEIVSRYADNENIFYLDIGDRFLAEDGELSAEIMPDYLHLSEQGYQIWAEAMEPALARLMRD